MISFSIMQANTTPVSLREETTQVAYVNHYQSLIIIQHVSYCIIQVDRIIQAAYIARIIHSSYTCLIWSSYDIIYGRIIWHHLWTCSIKGNFDYIHVNVYTMLYDVMHDSTVWWLCMTIYDICMRLYDAWWHQMMHTYIWWVYDMFDVWHYMNT